MMTQFPYHENVFFHQILLSSQVYLMLDCLDAFGFKLCDLYLVYFVLFQYFL